MLFSDFYGLLAPAEKVIIRDVRTYSEIKYMGYIEDVPYEYMHRMIVQISTLSNLSHVITIVLDKE